MFNGIVGGLSDLSKLSSAKSRSISPENPTGEIGGGGMATEGTGAAAARDLGQKWKISPSKIIEPQKTLTIADIKGPGAITHIWITITNIWRFSILRIYWDDSENPSVECPIGDFFASGWQAGGFAPVVSIPVCVNPASAFNCYWNMPFQKSCRITVENISNADTVIYYQIDYTLTEIDADCAYFHAKFNRTNPLPYKEDYEILNLNNAAGHYVGTYMAWGSNNSGWWGEGEIKFFMDSDGEFPTICGTGTEDYFCGSYNFDVNGKYVEFNSPYAGMPKVIRPDGLYSSQQRFSLYRWHLTDPVRFGDRLRVTIQALGWREGRRYLPLCDDLSSVAFWYQAPPFNVLQPPLPDKDSLEVI